jgi:transportin-3
MAANGAQHVFAPVLAAHSTMSSVADRAQKEQAHQYLEQFQKSVGHDKGRCR